MNQLWLVSLSVAVAIVVGALIAPLHKKMVSPVASAEVSGSSQGVVSSAPLTKEPREEQPSTIVAIEADSTASGDRLAHPPIRQTFADEPYQLVIFAEDSWETPLARAVFSQSDDILWEKALPHQYGPKFVSISAQGYVLLLDEFINVASPHAITLIDTNGKVVAQHSFKDIERTLQVSAADLTKQATTGWWISAPPVLNPSGDRATVAAGGTLLDINLTTGEISHHAQPTLPSK